MNNKQPTTNGNPKGLAATADIWRSLRNRNYRLFFIGQGVSMIGTWMQMASVSWAIYRLTNSPVYLGINGFASLLPSFFATPFAGVMIDRWDRRRTVITTQVLLMIQAVILAAFFLTGHVSVWHIITLSFFGGMINAFDMPARQALVFNMVKKENVSNAIALNSVTFNGARLIGPSLAGILIATSGESICFLINALSFIAVLAALWAIRIGPAKNGERHNAVMQDLKDGLRYASGSATIRLLLILLAVFSLMGLSYPVLMPVFARVILRGDSRTFGFLMTAIGVGALTGAFYLAARTNIRGLGTASAVALTTFSFGIFAFSFSRTIWLSLILIAFAGFGVMVFLASINTILQTVVEDDKRGRIMGLYTMAFMGMTPFGNLLSGAVAGAIGAVHTLQLNGSLCLLAAIVLIKNLPAIEQSIAPHTAEKITPEPVGTQ